MGFPGSGDITNWPCDCDSQGTDPTNTGVQYVISIGGLQGIVLLGDTGAITWTSVGNTLYATLSASAGLGTVTQVAASIGASANSNLTVSGSPINTNGTLTFGLAGNLGSISGLTMAADKMLYSTGVATFATTDLTAFARTLLDDAAAVNARSTLGLVIGTNVQAWSADLDSFVTAASWVTDDLTLTGDLSIGGNWVGGGTGSFAGALTVTGLISGGGGGSFSGNVTAGTFTGDGSALTALNATQLTTGTTAVARGGTNISSYAVGDLIYASGATTLSKLADVSVGSYLRSGGVTTAPLWSTVKIPNTATTGDLWYGSASNTISALADVATGNVLLSGGVGVAPAWGQVTSSHVNSTIATISAGSNSNITAFTSAIAFGNTIDASNGITIGGALNDSGPSPGNSGDLMVSTGAGIQWTNQITVDTLSINTFLSSGGTITAGGSTGAKTINKMCGTVRFAAGASSLIVTNNLATTTTRVLATVCTNDATAYIKNVTVTTGSFTIVLGANATAETEVFWELRGII